MGWGGWGLGGDGVGACWGGVGCPGWVWGVKWGRRLVSGLCGGLCVAGGAGLVGGGAGMGLRFTRLNPKP